MTALTGVQTLFAEYPFPGRDIVWVVDELVRVLQHAGSVYLAMVSDDVGGRCLVCTAPAVPGEELRLPQVRVGVFRAMLARIAVLASQETGTEFQPYGGRYALIRSTRSGPVRLEIEFTNTPASQQLSVTRVAISLAKESLPTNAGARVLTPQSADSSSTP